MLVCLSVCLWILRQKSFIKMRLFKTRCPGKKCLVVFNFLFGYVQNKNNVCLHSMNVHAYEMFHFWSVIRLLKKKKNNNRETERTTHLPLFHIHSENQSCIILLYFFLFDMNSLSRKLHSSKSWIYLLIVLKIFEFLVSNRKINNLE